MTGIVWAAAKVLGLVWAAGICLAVAWACLVYSVAEHQGDD